ncbi:mit family metal ion transporter cora [Lapidilactobacillus dextrinicus DSM 20335]|uniref:Mit family metal ion transporter cora n=1 Tax=Lapidilactobacillus dextrinicus DSM 20335 TaxID=1423738 RepID=A0A0R2BTQ9_9LACO|nr:magnesium transporter CorA family protein [Lapidilactobacillus dextrinicus]KRM79350.1 mit family metal ion transporter cora [Lapidilactobacillus dextrinicus DSM 20335]QFG46816.1 magnesium transporter CorA family protein [Lapidilactobacillus dextrinicus]
MLTYYEINEKSGIKKGTQEHGNWLVLSKATASEQQQVIETYQLPQDIFKGADEAEEIARFEEMSNSKLGDFKILSITDLSAETEVKIEARLEPLIFIIASHQIITYIGDNSIAVKRFVEKYPTEVTSTAKLLGLMVLMIYTHYIKELLTIKKTIDQLDQSARKTTETAELHRLADTERDVVFLDHTLRGQKKILSHLWDDADFIQELDDDRLLYNIRLRQEYAEELINIYRDLLETVGGLFNDMMNNNLNHLMKYLDSAALIISIPALISGIWGMNTGGLPGKGSTLGFMIVMALAIVLTVLATIHLKRKDYTK